MEIHRIKEAAALMKKGYNILSEMKEQIENDERLYTLAQLGLEQMPLERDFMQLVKYKLNDLKSNYEEKKKMLNSLKEFLAKQEREGEEDNEQ